MNTNVVLEPTWKSDPNIRNEGSTITSGVERSLASQEPNSGPKSSEKRPVKVCRVCGDRALGFNFGAVTCESCKTFFRRNFSRLEEFMCPYDNICPVTIASRKHCQKCRLRKCYAVGMSIETISKRGIHSARNVNNSTETAVPNDSQNSRCSCQFGEKLTSGAAAFGRESDTEKVQVEVNGGNVKIAVRLPAMDSTGRPEHNDMVKRMMSAIEEAVKISQSKLGGTAQQQNTKISRCTSGAEYDTHKNRIGQGFEKNLSNEKGVDNKRQRTDINTTIYINDEKRWLAKTQSTYSKDQSIPFSFTAADYSRHNISRDRDYLDAPLVFPSAIPLDAKNVKLEQLLTAHREWDRIDSYTPFEGYDGNGLTMQDHHKIVHFCLNQGTKEGRMLTTFAKLDCRDQVTLIKTRLYTIFLTRLSIKHNMETNKTYTGYPGCPEMSGDEAKVAGKDFYSECLKLKETYPEKFRGNDTILVILCAIALFNPECRQLRNRRAIDEERQLYMQLFKEYLESTFGQAEGRWAYRYLVTWLTSVCLCSKLHAHLMSYDIDPCTLGISELILKPEVEKYKTELE